MKIVRMAAPLSLLVFLAACGGGDKGGAATAGDAGKGAVQIDGSSTVYPVTEAVAEQFRSDSGKDVRVTVGVSGTGGGFKRFCAGETDISDASRPIDEKESALCKQNGVESIELPIGYDGIAVVVNPANRSLDCVTTAELKKVWEPDSKVHRWSDVRAGLPAYDIKLYAPSTAHGTFDYFTEAINGKAKASRADYNAADDYNVLVQGVAGDQNGLGYFGFAYYAQNKDKLKLVGVNSGSGCIKPEPKTIGDGTYKPLSRPIFIYVKKAALAKPEVASFVRYYMRNANILVPQVGYVPLGEAKYDANLQLIAGK
jgi:phosphate transport system substrate-binding protein